MERIAIFANDADHARRILQPLLEGADTTSRWVIVACPPVLTRHIGRWVSQAARSQWRERWSAELFAALEADLRARGVTQIERVIARRPLTDVSERLQRRIPGLHLLDARQPRVGKVDEPLIPGQPATPGRLASTLAATGGLSALLALAD